MSGAVLHYSPQSKAFTPRGSDGKWAPKGPVKLAEQGIAQNRPQAPPGPAVLTQKPTGK